MTPKQKLFSKYEPQLNKPKIIKIKENARCLICGVKKPLDTCHLIPQRFFIDIKGIDRKYLDYDGNNVMVLCKNHHTLFDRFNLEFNDFKKIWLKVDGILKDIAYNLIGDIAINKESKKIVCDRNKELINYIKKFNIYASTNRKSI